MKLLLQKGITQSIQHELKDRPMDEDEEEDDDTQVTLAWRGLSEELDDTQYGASVVKDAMDKYLCNTAVRFVEYFKYRASWTKYCPTDVHVIVSPNDSKSIECDITADLGRILLQEKGGRYVLRILAEQNPLCNGETFCCHNQCFQCL
jgi:hypothetical protein